MVELPNSLKSLFYDPATDSAAVLLESIDAAHSQALKLTDLSKGTLAASDTDADAAIEGFSIPDKGVDAASAPSLIAHLLDGVPRWHSPRTMYNVAPPPLLPTVTGKAITALYNPNLALNTASGDSLVTEQRVVKAVADYIGWDWRTAGGIFTSGGKATILYGIKLGLRRAYPASTQEGVKEDTVVFSTASGHPSHVSDSEWLGIGSANVMRLATDEDGRVDCDQMRTALDEQIERGRKIAAIVISGGTTNNMVVDPIAEVVDLRNDLVKRKSLAYSPHIHVDAVVAFPWIFFKDYDFGQNRLDIEPEALRRIATIVKDLRALHLADSFGIDFHKMGFCPYISSVFMIKDKVSLTGQRDVRKWPFIYSLENSRSADGPNAAFLALSVLGIDGFQRLIAHLTEIAVDLQERIEATGQFEIINRSGLGSSVMFVPQARAAPTSEQAASDPTVRNAYTSRFVEVLAERGNPYYIDQIPGDSTGGTAYAYTSLKAYVMSPHASKETNQAFVSYLLDLKREIDGTFDFTGSNSSSPSAEFGHPLKV